MRAVRLGVKIILIVAVALIILDAGFITLMAHWRPEIKQSQAVVVLGAAINTPALTNRTLVALDLYESGKADTMVLSGGRIADSDISEAQFMERILKINANNKVSYIIEDQSHNTYENIKNTKAKLGETESLIIVSDRFHIARAFLLAKRAGFKNVYWSSPNPTYYSDQDLRYYYFREFVAILSYIPKFIFG